MAKPHERNPAPMERCASLDAAPPVPESLRALWEERVAPHVTEAQAIGLRFRLDGHRWVDCATAAGLASYANLIEAAQRTGLQAEMTKSASLVRLLRARSLEANLELLRRLRDPKTLDAMDSTQLAVIDGIALDKLAKYERWQGGTAPDGAQATPFDRLAEAIRENGLEVEASITVRGPHGDAPAPEMQQPPTLEVHASERGDEQAGE